MEADNKQSGPDPGALVERLLKELEKAVHTVLGSSMKGVTKEDLKRTERNIMSAISDFASKQNQFNDRIDSAVTGLQGDIESLEAQITALQNSAGAITPEDQALLDGIQSRTATIADKLDALDALTPPTPPVA